MGVLVPHIHGRDTTKCYSLVLKKGLFIETREGCCTIFNRDVFFYMKLPIRRSQGRVYQPFVSLVPLDNSELPHDLLPLTHMTNVSPYQDNAYPGFQE